MPAISIHSRLLFLLSIPAVLAAALSLSSCAEPARGNISSAAPASSAAPDSGSASITFSAADPHGGSAALTINASGSGQQRTSNPSGQAGSQEGSGNLTISTTDPNGKSASITFSGSGNLANGNAGNFNGSSIVQTPSSGNGSVIVSGSGSVTAGGATLNSRNTVTYRTGIEGSNHPVTRTLPLQDFDALDIGSSCQASITQANRFEVQVTADDNILPYLHVDKNRTTLEVRLKDGMDINDAHLKVHITMPRLRAVTLSGASRAALEGFHGDDLGATVSGASRLIGSVNAPHVTFEASGASSIELTGNAHDAILGASGASQLRLEGCPFQTARVNLSGASQANLNVQQSLSYGLSGASQLRYRGAPVMKETTVSGASSVGQE